MQQTGGVRRAQQGDSDLKQPVCAGVKNDWKVRQILL